MKTNTQPTLLRMAVYTLAQLQQAHAERNKELQKQGMLTYKW